MELSEEQIALFDKLTDLQGRLVTNLISGMKPSDAHREAGGECKQESNRRVLAHGIITNHNVKAFLDSISYQAINEAVMGRAEMLERLSNLARANMSDLITWGEGKAEDDEGNEIVQSVWSLKDSSELDEVSLSSIAEVTAGAGGLKIKQHSPLAAMKQLADLEGYNKPVKTEQSGSVTVVKMSKEEYADVRKDMLAEDDC